MSLERGLAAILTADVLGYRRLTRDVDLIDQGPLRVADKSIQFCHLINGATTSWQREFR